MRICDINWGDDSAERDKFLLEYFVATESFQRLIEKRKSIVVGRKGSGKSALLRKCETIFSEDEDTYVIRLSPKFNSIRTVLNDQEIVSKFGKEIFFQHTWLRQILLDILCAVGHSSKSKFVSGFLEFARKVSVEQNKTSKDIVENITDILGTLKIKAGSLGDLGLQLEKELRNVADVDVLEHHVNEIAGKGKKFVILIDDLDLGWDNSEIANNILLGLLSATNYLGGAIQEIHTIIFLREDVYSILLTHTQHADKYRDVERIRWTKDSLIKVLSERINFNRRKLGEQEIKLSFESVFPVTIGTANTDNWLIERTLSRPRELIQVSRYYSEGVTSDQPSDIALKEAEPNYSSWKLEDLCSEYSNQYPGLISLFSYWKTKFFRQKYHLKYQEIEVILLDIMENVALDEKWFNDIVNSINLDLLLKILYEIGFLGDFILGGQGGSRTYYSYEDRHEPLFEEVQVHPCFRPAVNTVERIRNRSTGS
jgi:hypothetical protein